MCCPIIVRAGKLTQYSNYRPEECCRKKNPFLPSQNEGLLSATLFRTALCVLGNDSASKLVFNDSSLELSRLYVHNHVCH